MSQKPRPKTSDSVRSVERAIEVLEALNRRPLSTLRYLHEETGLPKPSLVRLLRTLEAEGLVAQTSSYSAYRLLSGVKSLSQGFTHEPPIVPVAEKLMIEFTEREGWPLALGLFDRDAMVVRASSIPYTALATVQSSLNVRLNLVDYAIGRAFLAHCSPSEQKYLLECVGPRRDPEDEQLRDEESIAAMLKQVRDRGYAIRDAFIWPSSSTFAVPIFEGSRVVASLGLTWLNAAMPVQKALDQYVPRLRAMAKAISRGLSDGTASKARTVTRSQAVQQSSPSMV